MNGWTNIITIPIEEAPEPIGIVFEVSERVSYARAWVDAIREVVRGTLEGTLVVLLNKCGEANEATRFALHGPLLGLIGEIGELGSADQIQWLS